MEAAKEENTLDMATVMEQYPALKTAVHGHKEWLSAWIDQNLKTNVIQSDARLSEVMLDQATAHPQRTETFTYVDPITAKIEATCEALPAGPAHATMAAT